MSRRFMTQSRRERGKMDLHFHAWHQISGPNNQAESLTAELPRDFHK